MPTTIQEIYTQFISLLSPSDRLRLATLILNNLVQSNTDVVDESDTWTEQDQLDLAIFSTQYAATAYPDSQEMD
ncbi:hypothetical protein [Microcoleus sp. bin38.metabat.b11b12b14.051]|uniref:hypothetical protein n=1 Tax=Microcoleus sp. bin38.metabat.b11b12b14.051 TaxID=2742709 RepID=UPI0025FE15B0|nr:hypothetical protein [Microcoleus sp. bin38.metabat.b11b12b14.051]